MAFNPQSFASRPMFGPASRALGWGLVLLALAPLPASGDVAAAPPAPVSFYKEVMPIFTQSCAGCHQPGKLKGGLDLTSFPAARAGGKHGPVFAPGDAAASELVKQIKPAAPGEKPEMPNKGEPLSAAEVGVIERWVAQGAKDDTPSGAAAATGAADKAVKGAPGVPGPPPPEKPPVYAAPPVITALAFSPDGRSLAISGYREVLLYNADGPNAAGPGLVGRLPTAATRIESLVFSKDGRLLAAGGGVPAMFGLVQVWDVPSQKLVKNFQASHDSVFGLSFSPDGKTMAFGCADKSARVIALDTGAELLRLDQHTDWCLGAAFTVDGKRLLTGGRDKAMKLTDLEHGQFIDDINNPLEPVMCLARHPGKDEVVCGGSLGTARVYKISDNQNRTAAKNDTNLLREFERQPGPVNAVAWSPDGAWVALAGAGEVRVYPALTDGKPAADAKDPNKDPAARKFAKDVNVPKPKASKGPDPIAVMRGLGGPVFAAAFSADSMRVAAGGYDGKVRVYHLAAGGRLMNEFVPAPLQAGAVTSGDPRGAP